MGSIQKKEAYMNTHKIIILLFIPFLTSCSVLFPVGYNASANHHILDCNECVLCFSPQKRGEMFIKNEPWSINHVGKIVPRICEEECDSLCKIEILKNFIKADIKVGGISCNNINQFKKAKYNDRKRINSNNEQIDELLTRLHLFYVFENMEVKLNPIKLKYSIPGKAYDYYSVTIKYKENDISIGLVAVHFNKHYCACTTCVTFGKPKNLDYKFFFRHASSFLENKAELYSLYVRDNAKSYKKSKIVSGDTLYKYPSSTIQEKRMYYPFRGEPKDLIPYVYLLSWSDYEPEDVFFEKKQFKQFYYTFKSQRDGKNYRLHYNARNGKFVNYKEIKNKEIKND